MKRDISARLVFLSITAGFLFASANMAMGANPDPEILSLLEKYDLPIVTSISPLPSSTGAENQNLAGVNAADASWKLLDEYYKNAGTPPTVTSPTSATREISERAWLDQELGMKYMDVKEDLTLREIDKRALDLVKEFQTATGGVTPTHGGNGAVHFTYSSYTPKIMCRPMRVTDIMLEAGEQVTGVHAGDTVRWTFTPSLSGVGESAVTHVMVKPLAPDISTNLIVHTNRRVYNLDLVSSSKEFFPSVSFGYPQDEMQKWSAFISDKRRTDGTTLNDTSAVNPEDLNFGYEIRGTQKWKPLRAWDDGRQVYIQMPKGWERSGMEAPVLIVYEKKKERIVNYRVKGDLIICDTLFKEKCALIAGTGSQQDRVVILKKN